MDQSSVSTSDFPLPDVVGDDLDDDLDENVLDDDDDDDIDTVVDDGATDASEQIERSTRRRPITKVLSRGFTPKSSCFFTESQPSVVTGVGSINM